MCEPEKAYEGMNEGAWLTQGNNYMAIHRLAVDQSLKRAGVASFIF